MDYRKLGRKHARRALKKLFSSSPAKECDCPSDPCPECLVEKAFEIFHDLQLQDSMSPEATYTPPTDEESEQLYNESAMDLIRRSVDRWVRKQRPSGKITHPHTAYEAGCEVAAEALAEAMENLSPEDYADDVVAVIRNRCRQIITDKQDAPDVHAAIAPYYNRGIDDTVESDIEVPPAQLPVTMYPSRVARFEKLLMNLHN